MALTDKLTAIADAIREKTGSTDTMTLDQMPEEINEIETGGGGFPNGTEWSIASTSFSFSVVSSSVPSICFANGVWVMSSLYMYNSSTTARTYGGIIYSTDGMTWVQSNITLGDYGYIKYVDGVWIAVCAASASYAPVYSHDGMTWTEVDFSVTGTIDGLEVCNGIIYCVGRYSSSKAYIYTSSDKGKTWTKITISIPIECFKYCEEDGTWVAGCASDDKGIYYSTDGMSWTQSNITSGKFYCFHKADGLWVAVSNNVGIYYSTDGMTWTQSNITSGLFYSIHKADGIWVAGGFKTGLYYSADGMTWTQSNINSGAFYQYSIHNADGVWVAGCASDDKGIYYSTDGMSWTQSNITNVNVGVVQNANGMWITAFLNNNTTSFGRTNGIYYSLSRQPSYIRAETNTQVPEEEPE